MPDPKENVNNLVLGVASTPEAVREAQQLRYRVFVAATALQPWPNVGQIDVDEFDNYCDHLTVRDRCTNEVVGTYRFLSPESARRCGRYYSETEFDISRLYRLRGQMAEAGRACIDPRFRSGAVLLLLWRGLATLLENQRCDYLIGCASVSLADGGALAASLSSHLATTHLAPCNYRVFPHTAFKRPTNFPEAPCIPPLLKSYLRSGAWIGGTPAWDTDFNCADFFLILPLTRLDQTYARRFFSNRAALSPSDESLT